MTDNSPRKSRPSLLERAAQRLDPTPGAPSVPAAAAEPVAPAAPRPTIAVAPPSIPRASVLAPSATRAAPRPGEPSLRPMPTPAALETPRAPGSQTAGDLRKSRRDDIDLEALREQGFILPDSPTTAIAEEFRIIKRQLLMNAMASGPNAIKNGNLILVCSSQPNEGKTFCAINLALSIASERDLTVMLIDADFAKPEILSTLGLEGGKGLLDLIIEPTLDLADCLIRTNIENFAVLPAGRQHNLTTELLASERMGEIIEDIAKRYPDRIIVVDSPPVLASSAAPVLAMYVGQTVYVVEAENTRDAEIREGISMLSACEHIQLLLNKARYQPGGRRYGTYYGYGV
jgi:receptor protein-tyrosine kinase